MIDVPWMVVLLTAVLLTALFLLRRGRGFAIPLVDAPSFRREVRRTSLFRIGVASLLVGLLALSAAVVSRPKESISDFVSKDSTTIIVLDYSTSISDLVYGEISRTLNGIVDSADESRKVGLVMFSEVAQEALPPDTTALELEPFIRYFRPKKDPAARARPNLHGFTSPGAPSPIQYPFSPWLRKFSSGTRISSGLALAREAIRRDGVRDARVLLISDLAEDKSDLPQLTRELAAYVRESIDLQIVGLPPAIDGDQELYRRILGNRRAVVESTSLATSEGEGVSALGGLSWWFMALIGLIAFGLAANEFLNTPVSWRAVTREAER